LYTFRGAEYYLTKEKIAGTNVKNKLENASFAAQAPAAEKDTSLLTSVVAVYPMVAKIDTAVPNMRLRTSAYLTKEKIAGTNVKNKLENASFAAQAPAAEKDTSLLTLVVAVYPMVAKINTAVPNMLRILMNANPIHVFMDLVQME